MAQAVKEKPVDTKSLLDDFSRTSLGWHSENLKIINKKSQLVHLDHNRAQLKVNNVMDLQQKYGFAIMLLILKARQRGISTFIEAKIFEKINKRKNVFACVASADQDSTSKVFKMCKIFQEEMPKNIRKETERSNRKEIVYTAPHRSGIICQTAGKQILGRGGTTHYVHATEVEFWANADRQLGSMLQEVPIDIDPDTMVVQETTANGVGGPFYKAYWEAVKRLRNLYDENGKINPEVLRGYIPIFLSWYDEEEYQVALPKGSKTVPDYLMTAEIKEYIKEGKAMGVELTQEQLYFAILTIQNKCGGDISRFKAEYPRTAREAFQSTGRMVFKPIDLDYMEQKCRPPVDYIEFYETEEGKVKYRSVNRQLNCWAIWKFPQENHSYVQFGDPAEGVLSDVHDAKSDPDRSVAAIFDRNDKDFPMTYYGRPNTIDFGDQMVLAAKFFNYAWSSPEMNSIGQSILDTFKRADYEYIYQREYKEETIQREDSTKFGWKTTVLTRKPMIADLQEVVRNHEITIYDIRFIEEMRVFVWNPQGKPEAEKGEHDDCVIALGGCVQLHKRCPLNEDLSFADENREIERPVAVMDAIDIDPDDDESDDILYSNMSEFD